MLPRKDGFGVISLGHAISEVLGMLSLGLRFTQCQNPAPQNHILPWGFQPSPNGRCIGFPDLYRRLWYSILMLYKHVWIYTYMYLGIYTYTYSIFRTKCCILYSDDGICNHGHDCVLIWYITCISMIFTYVSILMQKNIYICIYKFKKHVYNILSYIYIFTYVYKK